MEARKAFLRMARMVCNVLSTFGVWLSLVKRSSGGREIASSNLVTPILKKMRHCFQSTCRIFLYIFNQYYELFFIPEKASYFSYSCILCCHNLNSRYFSKLLQVFDIITIHQSQMTTKFALFIRTNLCYLLPGRISLVHSSFHHIRPKQQWFLLQQHLCTCRINSTYCDFLSFILHKIITYCRTKSTVCKRIYRIFLQRLFKSIKFSCWCCMEILYRFVLSSK